MEFWQVAAIIAAGAAMAALVVYLVARLRRSPEKIEQRRRLMVNRHGRLMDGVVTEATDAALYYRYSVGGVGYNASQDISRLHEFLPGDPARLIGPVWLKYHVRNPANSIILCEKWSGFQNLKEKQPQ